MRAKNVSDAQLKFLQKHVTNGYALVTGCETREAFQTSLQVKLSTMEQILEQAALAIKTHPDPTRQRQFEMQCVRARARRASQRRKEELQELRREKVEKVRQKNREPIKSTDLRRVVGAPRGKKRVLKDAAEQKASGGGDEHGKQQVQETYYDQ